MAVETRLQERVDEAGLGALKGFDPEEMVQDLDDITETSTITLMDLYRRWERQNWSAYALDFTQDAKDWAALPKDTTDRMMWMLSMFFQGEQAVTDTLAPWITAAPTEEMRIFLSTQCADEARHTVFFDRFYKEVVGVGGDLHGRLQWAEPYTNAAYQDFFWRRLPEMAREVESHPGDPITFARGIAFYHLVVEGMLAVPGQKYILAFCRDNDILPAFRSGFTAIARDESRHVGAGVRILQQLAAQEPGVEEAVRALIEETLPLTGEAFRPPNLDFNYMTIFGTTVADLNAFSVASLQKRIRGAGFAPMRTRTTIRTTRAKGEPILPPREKNEAQQLLESIRDDVTPALIFQGMQLGFNPDAAKGIHRSYQFDITGENGGTWTVKIDDGKMEMIEGPAPDGPPYSRLETDSQTWISMTAGEMSGDEAFLIGRLAFEGVLGGGTDFDSFFGAASPVHG
ncbi:MAG TPA: ribonucleotide-diphosphate reductase subunit beta [Candidatus Dormibacteraeota bacterium]|jgi:ribonucleoside-diphosphate reductase beta chain|nr:ribonucleotide-diphosphate reductase subunit beta [Candidatus Dormibacteraeota bacterium]